jgi:predicted nucleic acid-binding protein
MNIFVDANILVSVVNKEYPLFTYTSRILSLSTESPRYKVFTSPLCLAIAFYFAQKKNKKTAKEKITLLNEHLQIADVTHAIVQKALHNKAVHDFEDGMEYYSAIENKCTCIITEDTKDFYFSTVEVITAEGFFEKYLKAGGRK